MKKRINYCKVIGCYQPIIISLCTLQSFLGKVLTLFPTDFQFQFLYVLIPFTSKQASIYTFCTLFQVVAVISLFERLYRYGEDVYFHRHGKSATHVPPPKSIFVIHERYITKNFSNYGKFQEITSNFSKSLSAL